MGHKYPRFAILGNQSERIFIIRHAKAKKTRCQRVLLQWHKFLEGMAGSRIRVHYLLHG